jgi:hypothetical protein
MVKGNYTQKSVPISQGGGLKYDKKNQFQLFRGFVCLFICLFVFYLFVCLFICLFVFVFVCFHGRPRKATDVLQPAGLLYRPLLTFQLWPPDVPVPTDAFRTLAAGVGTYGRGIGAGILPKCRLPRYIQGSFTCRKSATCDPRPYFPSKGRRTEDFSALKNPTVSAGFEPANLDTRGQHANP